MNYDFEAKIKNKHFFPRDWNNDIDEVYDFLNIFYHYLEEYIF